MDRRKIRRGVGAACASFVALVGVSVWSAFQGRQSEIWAPVTSSDTPTSAPWLSDHEIAILRGSAPGILDTSSGRWRAIPTPAAVDRAGSYLSVGAWVSPNGKTLLWDATDAKDRRHWVVSTVAGDAATIFPQVTYPAVDEEVAWTPDSLGWLQFKGGDGTLDVYSVRSGYRGQVALPGQTYFVVGVQPIPGGGLMVVSQYATRRITIDRYRLVEQPGYRAGVRLVGVGAATQIALPLSREVFSVALSPDGKRLAVEGLVSPSRSMVGVVLDKVRSLLGRPVAGDALVVEVVPLAGGPDQVFRCSPVHGTATSIGWSADGTRIYRCFDSGISILRVGKR